MEKGFLTMKTKTFDTKTVFPALENVKGKKHTTTKQVDSEEEVEKADVVKLYDSYRAGGYKVSVTFLAPPDKDQKEDEVVSPFEVAEQLAKQGIDYKASLKVKSKGEYGDMVEVFKLIESEGYDYNVTATLKVNKNTTTNIDNPDSWTDEEANVFRVSPKASTDNIDNLKSLFDTLDQKGYEVEITIKPKAPKADDMDDEDDSFANQLSAYPDGTLVTFKLTEDDA